VTDSDVEARLRAALRARADQVTYASLRPMPVPGSASAAARTPAAPVVDPVRPAAQTRLAPPTGSPPHTERPPRAPRRRRRWVWAVPVAAMAMFAVGLFAGRVLWPSSDHDSTLRPGSSAGGGGSAGSGSTSSFAGIRFTLPTGWQAVPSVKAPTVLLCVAPASVAAPAACGSPRALLLYVLGPGGYPLPKLVNGDFMLNDYGWMDQSGATCPDGSKVTSSKAAPSTYPHLADGRKAQFTQWTVTCASGAVYTPTAWLLPKSRVYLSNTQDQHGDDLSTFEAIVASMDLTGLHRSSSPPIPTR
jgi:hypothetical protein